MNEPSLTPIAERINMTTDRPNRIPPNQQLIREDRWPVVGEKRAKEDDSPWRVSVEGEVAKPLEVKLDELTTWSMDEVVTDIHCVTRWSRFDMRFRGILLDRLFALVEPTREAQFVSFTARSERAHSTSLPIEFLKESRSIIALEANGQPLEPIHGGPIRVVVPGKYFYKSVKWLTKIEFLAVDRLGYWEAEAGYHNGADPWLEERYLAPTLDKKRAQQLIESRDFSNQDLRGIDCSNRTLDGLNAEKSLLRDARFLRTSLQGANFAGANLSNADLRNADLTNANLNSADLEGADLRGAILHNVDMLGCSLFGATFTEEPGASDSPVERRVSLNQQTQLTLEQLVALTDHQRAFMEVELARHAQES